MITSPAVERIESHVRQRASERGETQPTLADWFSVLLDDDEGRPAEQLFALNVSLETAREFASNHLPHQHAAPPSHQILTRGRDLSTIMRADPTVTTDFVFLAVVEAAEMVDGGFSSLGASLGRLAEALGSVSASPQEPPAVSHFPIDDPVDSAATGRILDASFNRARESLRVLDDFARFALDDKVITGEIKSLRHRLVDAVALLPIPSLAASRNTPGDVGTTLSASGEYTRSSARQTALINFKRLQESLRSLEEYGKSLSEQFARKIEAIRYASYTLEAVFTTDSDLRTRLKAAKLYILLTGSQCQASLDWTIREAAQGGASVFQLREKSLTDAELLERARNVRRWTRETRTLFIMNDRPDIARLADADGVHLGQDDLPVAAARAILGPGKLIGVSTHNVDQIHRAVLEGADYLGVGPVFPSTTKSFDAFPGLTFVHQAAATTSLPCFALGGITTSNVNEIVNAGLRRIAVASAVTTAEEPRQASQILYSALE
ncbi:MAG: thiamine phosphate synthase [Gemmataceae bacterium]